MQISLLNCNEYKNELLYLDNYPNYIDSLLLDTIRNKINIYHDSFFIETKVTYTKVYSWQKSDSGISEKSYIDSGLFMGNSSLSFLIGDSIYIKDYFFQVDTSALKLIEFTEIINPRNINYNGEGIAPYKIVK